MLEPIHERVIQEKSQKKIGVNEAINIFKEVGIQNLRPSEEDINQVKQ